MLYPDFIFNCHTNDLGKIPSLESFLFGFKITEDSAFHPTASLAVS